MPKATFFSLADSKRKRVYLACRSEFEKYPIYHAKVDHIVKALNISRGSFYQYFEDLQECYFYVLSQETVGVHQLFFELLQEHSLEEALKQYKFLLLEKILHSQASLIYKHYFLDWNFELEQAWQKSHQKTSTGQQKSQPLVQLLKAVVHDLMYRYYAENWTDQYFLEQYEAEMALIQTEKLGDFSKQH